MKNKAIEIKNESIGFFKLHNSISVMIICSFIFSIAVFFWLFYIQYQINDLPKRVCWNETIEEEIISPYTCIIDNSQGIHCENITLKSGEVYQTNCYNNLILYRKCFNSSEVVNPQKEIIKSTKEICEVR